MTGSAGTKRQLTDGEGTTGMIRPEAWAAAGAALWMRIGTRFLPFADAASRDLPLGRLLRLSLFQVTVGIATVMLVGTLNRVMIVELAVPATLVAIMVALPILTAPFRALIGHRSDAYRSALGWRRAPFIALGTMLQFGGFAIMPFALMILSGDGGPVVVGLVASAIAFLLVGLGLQMTQTAGLALACDLAPPEKRPRVVALMYAMLLLGMVGAALVLGLLLASFSAIRLIQVVQGAAVVIAVLNGVALWKQEPRNHRIGTLPPPPPFAAQWRAFLGVPGSRRFLAVVALGSAAFSMQDVILEPFGGEILALSVSATTSLTALVATGAIAAFWLAARQLALGTDAALVASLGLFCGLPAFVLILLAAPLGLPGLFLVGVALLGFGGGLFAVGTLTQAMHFADRSDSGLALGAWGAAQATASGLAIAMGGLLRDGAAAVIAAGGVGGGLATPAAAYGVVYLVELILVFAALAAIGPLASHALRERRDPAFGMAELPQ